MRAHDVARDRGKVGDQGEHHHDEQREAVDVVAGIVLGFERAQELFLFFGGDGVREVVVFVECVGMHTTCGGAPRG